MCTGRSRGTECFCGTVTQRALSENNRLKEEEEGKKNSRCAFSALHQQVEHFWLTAWALNNEPEFTQLGRNRSWGHLHFCSSDPLPERCCTLKPCGRRGLTCPDTTPAHAGRTPGLIIITFYEHSVSRSDAARLSVCHVNALSGPRLAQLVAPTHVVISCKGGWTDSARGKVNCDFSCWAAG